MNDPDSLVRQLFEVIQRRMEAKVLNRLKDAGGTLKGVGALLDEVIVEEQSELDMRATEATANGEAVQADLYQRMRYDLLPQAAEGLRDRLRRA